MSRSSRHFVLLLVLTIAPTPAHAENNSTRARLHYDRGSAAYESRNYELAIVEFQKSLVDAERPASYYALGLAGESAHREDVAVVGYRKYLLLAPMGPVQLHDHASAYVTEYDLRAQRARELERDRQVERERGTHPGNSLVPSSVSSSRWYTSAAGWGLLAGGIAITGVGGGLWGHSKTLYDQAATATSLDSRAGFLGDAGSFRTAGWVVVGVGGAGVVSGIVILALRGRQHSRAFSASSAGNSALSSSGAFE